MVRQYIILCTVVVSISLLGCAGPKERAVLAQIGQHIQQEADANQRAIKVAKEKCDPKNQYDVMGNEGEKQKVMTISACGRKVLKDYVRPYTKYPQLFDAFLANAQSIDEPYKRGDIDFNEYNTRFEGAYQNYVQAIREKLSEKFGQQLRQAEEMDKAQVKGIGDALGALGDKWKQSGQESIMEQTYSVNPEYANCRYRGICPQRTTTSCRRQGPDVICTTR
jgi:hypothetical protein